VQAGLVIEDGAVELLLGGKMAKHHRFRDAGGQGNLFSGGAAKAALRKQAHGHAQDLQAPVLARHPGAVSNFFLKFHSK
jgi:hypothetical protein